MVEPIAAIAPEWALNRQRARAAVASLLASDAAPQRSDPWRVNEPPDHRQPDGDRAPERRVPHAQAWPRR